MQHPYLNRDFLTPWRSLTPEHIVPDITLALENAQANLDALKRRAPGGTLAHEPLTYDNTLLAFEAATEELSDAWGKVGHLDSVNDSPEHRKAYNEMLPKVSDFFTSISLDSDLYALIRAYSESDDAQALTGAKKRFLEETLKDFEESGAALPEDKKKRLAKINSELSRITQKFSENVLDSTNAWELIVEDESRLAGLPESAKAAALEDAKRKGKATDDKPAWRFTLHAPSYVPLITYADDDALREQAWRAASAIGAEGKFDNTQLIRDTLALRHEKAQLLGCNHFADYVIARRMAKSGQAALDFTTGMHDKITEAFQREITELEAFRAEQTGDPIQRLQPWEAPYWSEKLRRSRYDFDEEELRPYFPVNRVMSGMFELTQKLFNIRIDEREGVEAWHDDVQFYDIYDSDSGKHLGSFYADWYPRESKRGGAWMNPFRTGSEKPDGTHEPHSGLIAGNMTPSVGGKPALLNHREVETIFHEFGHLLHHTLSEVEVKSLSGTNVSWDFVELPSQIMENWCWERDSLDLFARHYETGAPIPDELFDKLVAAKNFQSAMFTMRQLSFGKLDLDLHIHYEQYQGRDLDDVIDESLKGYTIPLATKPPSIARRFSHLFSSPTGYAAGYYSYKWAEVLDADAFTRFKQDGILNSDTGRAFRDAILSKGNSQPPDELFRAFMGRDPDQNALLIRSGLA